MTKAAEIAAALEQSKLDVLRYLLPGGQVRGHEFCAGSLRGEAGASLKVNVNGKGCVWCDFATDDKGGDLLDLWAQARCHGNVSDAMREAADWLGFGNTTRTKAKPHDERPTPHPQLGEPAALFSYYTAAGELIGHVARFNHPDGGKEFRPCIWRGDRWDWSQGFAKPRPLYRLPDLAAAPSSPVLLVEGEKAADVAAVLVPGHLATTWPGGTGGVEHANFSPLKGRDVTLWPDADAPGRKAMDAAARLLAPIARSVRLVELPADTPEKWDVADPMPPTWAPDTLERLIAEARPVAGDERLAPLPYTVVSSLAGQLPPPRAWCVPDWIPDHAVTILNGDGGVGKSILAIQLHISCAAGIPWLGLPVDPRPSFYFSAEDPFDEVHRRVFEIAAAMGVDVASLDKFAFCSFADDDAILMAPGDRHPTILRPTEVWERLALAVDAIGARLVTIDTAADTFGGDEVKRREVRAFVSLLSRRARAINGAVILTAHPSNEGLRTGSGTSGSTGWNNSTRSRLYLTNPGSTSKTTDADDQDADPDARTLTRKKANFARVGESIELRWQAGALVAVGEPTGIDRIALHSKADRVFRELLRTTYAAGSWVSANSAARNYAPSIFSRHPDREGIGKAALEGAMHRLSRNSTVRIETYGRPSEPRSRLAPA